MSEQSKPDQKTLADLALAKALFQQRSMPAGAPDPQYVIDIRHHDSLCAHENASGTPSLAADGGDWREGGGRKMRRP